MWLALWGASLIGAGIFTTDPVSGYPAGTPTYPDGTVSRALHDLFALLGIVGLIGAFVALRKRGGPGWSAYSLGTLVVLVVCFALGAVGTGQISGLVDIAGPLERIAVIGACAWLTALALRTRPA